ncbi:thiamine transporter 1 [Hypomesus transpacificus]|uniref:thiamine transporter 1 n=1 Tax=Hypomesus transpacificus TaxID=137520 RepID=UPI001F087A94|nr:thiamine transporter 1 [Hypomesus transpacificus]
MEVLRRWKAGWGYPTSLLCCYGFFSTVKPMEPFLIPYMTGPDKNLTVEQVNNEIFPVWTYSYLSVLVPVFLLTDWLRYKPVVVFQSLNLFITTALLLWLQGVAAMQAMQFFYGVVTACEVAYFSYIYSVVDLTRYRKATSYCRSVQLLGYTAGSVLGQLLLSFDLMSYNNILVLTLVLTSIALVTSCFLPMPRRSMFFHRSLGDDRERKLSTGIAAGSEGGELSSRSALDERGGSSKAPAREENSSDDPVEAGGSEERPAPPGGCLSILVQLWRDFLDCYSSRQLLYWSVWWALATCGYNQTVNYVQVLWEHVEPSQNITVYNGAVEAVSNLCGAATAYGIGFTQVNWAQWGELALGIFSGLGAASLFLMTYAGNIWVCYVSYILFKTLYMLLITIAMFQIAAELSMERYALIFGANTFGALVLQTVITSIVVDSRGLGLDITTQFIIYGSYFSAIALLFLVRGVYCLITQPQHKDPPASELPPRPQETGRAHSF